MRNSKSKYYQAQNKSKIPNSEFLDFEIGIYLVVLVVLGFGIFLCIDELEASTDVPIGHWVYEALEDLAMTGMTDLVGLHTRPISRIAVAHRVAEMIEKVQNEELPFSYLEDELAMNRAEALLYKLMDEFKDELTKLGVDAVIRDNEPPKNITIKIFDGLKKELIYIRSSHSGTKNIRLENKQGWTLEEDFNGRLKFRSRVNYKDIAGLSIEPAFYGSKDKSKLTLDEALLSLIYENIEFGIGRTSMWWGPGKHGALLLSNNTRPLYLAKIGSMRPFKAPYIEDLGLWNINFFTSKLIGEDSRTIKEPYLSGLRVEFSPSMYKRLNFGFNHTIMWGGKGGEDVSFVDFLDMFLAKMGGGADEPENHLISFTAEWSVPGLKTFFPLADGALLYGEIGAEDERGGLPSDIAGLIGIRIIDLLIMEDLDLIVEYAKTNDIWYTHYAYRDGYTSRGNILGHHLGADSDDIFISLSKKFGEQFEIDLWFDGERHGLDGSVVEKKYEAGINFKYQYIENLILEADYEFEHYDGYRNISSLTNKNHIISIGGKLQF